MDEKRLSGLMGLCVRAGQAVFGEEGCLKALREDKAALLLMDGAISDATCGKYESLCRRKDIPAVRLRPGLLAESTGRTGMAMAVRTGGLAEQIRACLD